MFALFRTLDVLTGLERPGQGPCRPELRDLTGKQLFSNLSAREWQAGVYEGSPERCGEQRRRVAPGGREKLEEEALVVVGVT